MPLLPDAKILVMTDIHFVDPADNIVGIDPYPRFKEVLDHAVTHHADANAIIITGDLTHHGLSVQYERLKGLLLDVDIPITLMLGNHDHRDTYRSVFGGEGFAQTAIEIGDTKLICLDTLDGPPYPDGHNAGLLCEDRLAWLDDQLATTTRAIVFMHHPPFDIGFDGMDAIKLQNPDAFFDVIKRHCNVAHIICGHVHRTISGHARGVPYTIFKSPCHQMPMLLGAAGTSHSVDEPGAYGILLLHDDGLVCHSEDVGLSNEILHDPVSM